VLTFNKNKMAKTQKLVATAVIAFILGGLTVYLLPNLLPAEDAQGRIQIETLEKKGKELRPVLERKTTEREIPRELEKKSEE